MSLFGPAKTLFKVTVYRAPAHFDIRFFVARYTFSIHLADEKRAEANRREHDVPDGPVFQKTFSR